MSEASNDDTAARRDRWREVDAVLEHALELPEADRDRYLIERCGDDEELLARVRRLLAVASEPDTGLAAPDAALLREVWAFDEAGRGGIEPGDVVGRYRILGELGRGGMATVYDAERADGAFERRVAIKILRRGLDTDEIVARFLAERQILSGLEHPNIARLIDGGATDDGRPYLVMERVSGEPITDWADRRGLSIRERLELFGQVAGAVRFAHQRLIIHRDLKPSNVLVDDGGTVKLLDFGIAKLLDTTDGAGADSLTRTGVRPLTPAYASPEQIRGAQVTTASDVYQLGALLYELLSGERPHRTQDRTPLEIERSICEDEPPRPSRQVTDPAAGVRGEDRTSLERALSGDLDTITLKALDKDPARRYSGAGELVDDVERYLAGLPVSARPATVGYRVRKFARRHPYGFAAGAAFVVVLAGYAITVTAQARQIAQERDRARVEAARAEQVTTVFAELFEEADPFRVDGEAGGEMTVREALDRGAVRVREELAEQPEVLARLLGVMGNVYLNLGLYDEAEPLLRESLATYEGLTLPPDAARGEVASNLAHLLQETGEVEESEALFRTAIEVQRAVLAPNDPALAITLTRFGGLLWFNKGDHAGADSVFREALTIRRSALDRDDPVLTTSLNSMANLLHSQGDHVGAEPFYREAIELYREQLGEHPNVAIVQSNFAALLRDKGDYGEAEAVQRQALELHRRTQGERNIDVALGLGSLGSILLEQARWAEAEDALEAGLEQQIEFFEPGHPYVLRTRHYLARLRIAQGRFDEARSTLAELDDAYAAAFPPGHFALADPVLSLGRLELRTGDAATAVPLIRDGLSIREEAYDESHWQVAEARSLLGAALTAVGELEEAERLLLGALETLEASRGDENPYVRETLQRLVALYEARGASEAGAPYRMRLE